MSDWTDVCDAIKALYAAGPLSGAIYHLYAPWDPEELTVDTEGQRHVGIWAVGEGFSGGQSAEEASGGTGFDIFKKRFRVIVWERTVQEGERGVRDESANAAWLQLHNDVRAIHYLTANRYLGSSEVVRYQAAGFPERSGRVRWFAIELEVEFSLNYS